MRRGTRGQSSRFDFKDWSSRLEVRGSALEPWARASRLATSGSKLDARRLRVGASHVTMALSLPFSLFPSLPFFPLFSKLRPFSEKSLFPFPFPFLRQKWKRDKKVPFPFPFPFFLKKGKREKKSLFPFPFSFFQKKGKSPFVPSLFRFQKKRERSVILY